MALNGITRSSVSNFMKGFAISSSMTLVASRVFTGSFFRNWGGQLAVACAVGLWKATHLTQPPINKNEPSNADSSILKVESPPSEGKKLTSDEFKQILDASLSEDHLTITDKDLLLTQLEAEECLRFLAQLLKTDEYDHVVAQIVDLLAEKPEKQKLLFEKGLRLEQLNRIRIQKNGVFHYIRLCPDVVTHLIRYGDISLPEKVLMAAQNGSDEQGPSNVQMQNNNLDQLARWSETDSWAVSPLAVFFQRIPGRLVEHYATTFFDKCFEQRKIQEWYLPHVPLQYFGCLDEERIVKIMSSLSLSELKPLLSLKNGGVWRKHTPLVSLLLILPTLTPDYQTIGVKLDDIKTLLVLNLTIPKIASHLENLADEIAPRLKDANLIELLSNMGLRPDEFFSKKNGVLFLSQMLKYPSLCSSLDREEVVHLAAEVGEDFNPGLYPIPEIFEKDFRELSQLYCRHHLSQTPEFLLKQLLFVRWVKGLNWSFDDVLVHLDQLKMNLDFSLSEAEMNQLKDQFPQDVLEPYQAWRLYSQTTSRWTAKLLEDSCSKAPYVFRRILKRRLCRANSNREVEFNAIMERFGTQMSMRTRREVIFAYQNLVPKIKAFLFQLLSIDAVSSGIRQWGEIGSVFHSKDISTFSLVHRFVEPLHFPSTIYCNFRFEHSQNPFKILPKDVLNIIYKRQSKEDVCMLGMVDRFFQVKTKGFRLLFRMSYILINSSKIKEEKSIQCGDSFLLAMDVLSSQFLSINSCRHPQDFASYLRFYTTQRSNEVFLHFNRDWAEFQKVLLLGAVKDHYFVDFCLWTRGVWPRDKAGEEKVNACLIPVLEEVRQAGYSTYEDGLSKLPVTDVHQLDWSTPEKVHESSLRISPRHFFEPLIPIQSWEFFSELIHGVISREDMTEEEILKTFEVYFNEVLNKTTGPIESFPSIRYESVSHLLKTPKFLARLNEQLLETILTPEFLYSAMQGIFDEIYAALDTMDSSTDDAKKALRIAVENLMISQLLQKALELRFCEKERGEDVIKKLIELEDLLKEVFGSTDLTVSQLSSVLGPVKHAIDERVKYEKQVRFRRQLDCYPDPDEKLLFMMINLFNEHVKEQCIAEAGIFYAELERSQMHTHLPQLLPYIESYFKFRSDGTQHEITIDETIQAVVDPLLNNAYTRYQNKQMNTFDSKRGAEGYFIGRIDLNDLTKRDKDNFAPLLTVLAVPPCLRYRNSVEKWALYILENTQDPNPTTEYVDPPIFLAINHGLTKVVQKMVELGLPKDLKNSKDQSLLEAAKFSKNPEIIQILQNCDCVDAQ